MKNKPSLLDIEAFNKKREQELELEASVLEEDSNTLEMRGTFESKSELVKLVYAQKDEIDRIKNELTRVVAELKAHKQTLEHQEKEIAALKDGQAGFKENDEGNNRARRADDQDNKEMILRYIVTLIEEKGFSHNDVARLFKLEGFLPPSPYPGWDDKVVAKLYALSRQ